MRSSQHPRIGLAAAGVLLGMLLLTVSGAWAEARWHNPAGEWITVTPVSEVSATEGLWLLRQVAGVQAVLAVFRADAQLDAVEPIPWASVNLYAVDASLTAGESVPPMPSMQLAGGRPPALGALNEVALSYEVAQALRRRLGDVLSIYAREFEVVGIWAPSARVSGNWMQVSRVAGDSLRLFQSRPAHHYLVEPAPGQDTAELAQRIWRGIQGMQVLSPNWERAQARQERAVLALSLGFAVILALLLVVPLLGDLHREWPSALLPVVLLSGATGLAAGWTVVLLANGYARDTVALTPFRLTLRLVAALVFALLAMTLLSVRGPRRWPQSARPWLAGVVLALCGGAIVVVGALAESLNLAIVDAQSASADRVTVQAHTDNALLQGMYRLPGVRGYAIEAYAGTVDEKEADWLGPWPASGMLYGVRAVGIEGTLSVPYHVRLHQGRFWAADALDEAVVGFDLAQARGLDIGDRLQARDTVLTVVGILQHVRSDGLTDVNWRVQVSLETLRRITHDPGISGELTLLIPPAKSQEDKALYLQEAADRLQAPSLSTVTDRLAEIVRRYPMAWTLSVASAPSVLEHAQTLYANFLWWCACFLFLTGALAIMGAFGRRLTQEERRVGLLKAFGVQDGTLVGAYLEEAIVLGVAAGLLGLCSGWVVLTLLNALAADRGVELLLSPRLGAGVFFLVLLTSAIAAAIPISRSARHDAMPVLYDMTIVGGSTS